MSVLNWIKKKIAGKPDVIYVHPVKMGGPGTCPKCGREVSNLGYHQARCEPEAVQDAATSAALRVLKERAEKRRLLDSIEKTKKNLDIADQELDSYLNTFHPFKTTKITSKDIFKNKNDTGGRIRG